MKSYNLDIIKLSKYIVTLASLHNVIITPIQLYKLLYLLQRECLQQEDKLLFNNDIYFKKEIIYIEEVFCEFHFQVGGIFLFNNEKVYDLKIPFYLQLVCNHFLLQSHFNKSYCLSNIIDYFRVKYNDSEKHLITYDFFLKTDNEILNDEFLIQESFKKNLETLIHDYNNKIKKVIKLAREIQQKMKSEIENDTLLNINDIEEKEIFNFLLEKSRKVK
ncbi:hypothetical protein C4N15_07230 [Fusobacterium necrophorum subsp. funduliforme]|jgi:hypothetical protein|uniref:hypothetical protein n=1 Tax=Fusobacterium necrophorum TaxID=859 RepID=UPI000D131C4A|nr:hypothetical protein [Fusobacterium necrophorum]AVQ21449.1 hypothetical protein C4N15_07230 [Fusobacterium necrophorum subsp. funduliforme]